MTERPIIFSAEMVRAILEGRKTQTRRIVRLPHQNPLGAWEATTVGGDRARRADGSPVPRMAAIWHTRTGDTLACPYGLPGDRLWVIQGAGSWAGLSPEERFWSRVVKTDGCWEWFGRTNRKKYGYMKVGQRLWWVHRYSYQLHHGQIPNGLHVLHKCDLPWCVNPSHLYVGDNNQNIADKVARGRVARLPGQANGQAKLSQADIAEIRRLHLEEGVFQKDLAAQFGVGQPQVSRIVSGKRWAEREAADRCSPLLGSRTLEVTDVRVERVQEISGRDCFAEGIIGVKFRPDDGWPLCTGYTIGPDDGRASLSAEPQTPYARLWDQINGPGAWERNDWVWVVSFRRTTQGEF